MATPDEKIKRQRRRKDHLVKDLRTPKYRERVVPVRVREDEDERRFRRYHSFDEYFPSPEWSPLNEDD